PVPSFEPSPEAFAVSTEMVQIQRRALADAVERRELGPAANEENAIFLVSTLITGVLSQAIANEPGLPWGEGRFTPMFPTLMRLLPAAFPLECGLHERRRHTLFTCRLVDHHVLDPGPHGRRDLEGDQRQHPHDPLVV